MSRIKNLLNNLGESTVDSSIIHLVLGFVAGRDTPFELNLSTRYSNLLVRGSLEDYQYDNIINIVKYQLSDSERSGKVIIKHIDNTWRNVRWKQGLKQDLEKSGILGFIRNEYIKIFLEGKDRQEILQKKNCRTFDEYMKEKRRKGNLAQLYGYDKDIVPMIVLVNDCNLMDQSSFLEYCSYFIKSSAALGIYFIVCGGTVSREDVPNLVYDINLNYKDSADIYTPDGYRKTFVDFDKL